MELYLSREGSYLQKASPLEAGEAVPVKIDEGLSRFPFLGFGGAFTESAAHVYASLSEEDREAFLKACFSRDGLAYTFGRVCVGSSDFSLGEFDYTEGEDLSTFSLSHEDKKLIPMLLDAKKEAASLSLLASTWSPLALWKDNGQKCHGGKLKPEDYPKQAQYVALFRKEMEKRGLPVSCLTVQNEPEAKQTWESCLYSPEEEAALLKELKKENPDAEIFVHDHNRDNLRRRIDKILSLDSIDASGVAFHWYDRVAFEEVKKAVLEHPDKRFIFTEGCVETLTNDFAGEIGAYSSFLRYLENYIQDLNNGCTLFLDWNLLLDEKGGPNHVGNFCEAPVMMKEGKPFLLPSYYAIYHLSHFIRPGAKSLRLDSPLPDLFACGVINPDGTKVFAFLNRGEKAVLNVSGCLFALEKDQAATLLL